MEIDNSIELVTNTSNFDNINYTSTKQNNKVIQHNDSIDTYTTTSTIDLERDISDTLGNYSKLLDTENDIKSNRKLLKKLGKTNCLLFINKSKPLIVIGPDCKY